MRTVRPMMLTLLAIVILLMVPRFNQQDWGISSFTGTDGTNFGDAEQYIAVAGYFAGEPRESLTLMAPFTDRPLVPALASVLPGEHLNGLNLVNAFSILAACVATFFTALRVGLGSQYSVVAAALLGISFPVFYYATIGYVDPVGVAVLAVGLLATLYERWFTVLVLVILGVLIKESAGVAGVVAAAYIVTSASASTESRRRAYGWAAVILAAMGGAFLLSRNLVPHDTSASWDPTLQHLRDNVTRPRSAVALVLTFGLPTLIVLTVGRTAKFRSQFPTPVLAALAVGIGLAIAQGIVGTATVYLDGRYVWGAQPFLVILAAAALRSRLPLGWRTG